MIFTSEQKNNLEKYLKQHEIKYKLHNYINLNTKIEFQQGIDFEKLENIITILNVNKSSVIIRSSENKIWIFFI